MTTKLVQDLEAVREWLSDPAHWTKGVYGADKDGVKVSVLEEPERVAATCLVGAIVKVTGSLKPGPVEEAIKQCVPFGHSPLYFNDYLATHADILTVLDCALEKARRDC